MNTILFVDDHHSARTVFAEILRSAGYVVLEAGTMAEAERLAEQESGAIDLLIAEAVLSTTNGLEVAQRLQSQYPGLRVLMVSEQPPEALFDEGLLRKGAPFLPKPFTAEELIEKVKQLTEAPRAIAAKARTSAAGQRKGGKKRAAAPRVKKKPARARGRAAQRR